MSALVLLLLAIDPGASLYKGADGGWTTRVNTAAGGAGTSVNVTNQTADTTAVAVRCVTAAGSAFESCAGSGGSSTGWFPDGGAIGSVTVTGTVAVSGPLTDAQLRATPVPVSGTVTATVASTTITGSVAVTGPVTDAQLRATAVPVSLTSTTITGTVAATQSGAWSLAANQSVNVAQINAVTPLMGNGVTGTGSPRVTIASDNTAFPVNAVQSGTWTVQPGNTANTTPWLATARIVGNAGGVIDAANNAAAPANVVVMGVQLQSGATATAGTAGQVGNAVAGLDHVLYVRPGGPVNWSCFVQAATVTTQCLAAPAAGLKAYVTGIGCSNQAATVQGVDVVYGTGAACATGIAALTHKYQMGTNATTTSPFESDIAFSTPLVPAAANAICVRPTAATAFGCTLTGYTAP